MSAPSRSAASTSLARPPGRVGSIPIRVASVHSFYSSRVPSGENRAVESEVEALQRAGHDIRLFAARTDDFEGSPAYRATSALRVASGLGRSPLSDMEA